MSKVLKMGEVQITNTYSATHQAVDIVKSISQLETIIAHSSGRVVFCQTGQKNNKGSSGNASYGNCVKIEHSNGYATLYAHLATVYVNLGDVVSAGQEIGYMGDSGNAYGAHLHFEVWKDGKRIDPTEYLDKDLPQPQKVKTTNELANEVIKGLWGNGAERKERLTSAGYNYNEVQSMVNSILKDSAPQPAKKTNEEIAREVTQGLWGNGAERKERLTSAGYNYSEIQKIVNGLL